MSIIFSKLAGTNDPYIGKFEHPIKALIENESNILEKRKLCLTFSTMSKNRNVTPKP